MLLFEDNSPQWWFHLGGTATGRWGEPCLTLPGDRGDRKFRVLNNRKAASSDVGRTGSDREASYDRPRSLYFIL